MVHLNLVLHYLINYLLYMDQLKEENNRMVVPLVYALMTYLLGRTALRIYIIPGLLPLLVAGCQVEFATEDFFFLLLYI